MFHNASYAHEADLNRMPGGNAAWVGRDLREGRFGLRQFARCVVVVVRAAMRRILFICAAIPAVWFLINLSSLYARVKLDRSYPALSRYEFEPTPDVALVGSSMTFRISEGYFQQPIRNLSISGGSPLTGLSIIASYQSIPRMVLVETNIMTRPVDSNLVEQFGKNDTEPFKWFRPFRAAISATYYHFKYKPVGPIPESVKIDISESIVEAMKEYSSTQFDDHIALNIEELKRIVTDLERRGCKIALFELPYPQPLGDSYLAVKDRNLIRAAFPQESWLQIQTDHLNFVDAFHMDERSAANVARDIEGQVR
jgi:hypothetical protein